MFIDYDEYDTKTALSSESFYYKNNLSIHFCRGDVEISRTEYNPHRFIIHTLNTYTNELEVCIHKGTDFWEDFNL
jgi:hypothetical protein